MFNHRVYEGYMRTARFERLADGRTGSRGGKGRKRRREDPEEDPEGTVQVNSDQVAHISACCDSNALVYAIEQLKCARVVGDGFSLHYKDFSQDRSASDTFHRNVLQRYWTPLVRKAAIHVDRVGFYVVAYAPSNPTDEDSDRIPIVLDLELYRLKFHYDDVGRRVYRAFRRATAVGDEDRLMEGVRIFVVHEPLADGTVNSPMQKCLPYVHRIEALWDNLLSADSRRANPVTFFVYDKIHAQIGARASAEAMSEISYSSTSSSEVKRRGTADYDARVAFEGMVQESIATRMNRDGSHDSLCEPAPDPNAQGRGDAPWAPYKHLSSGSNVQGGPAPDILPNFAHSIQTAMAVVAATVGVSVEYIMPTGAKHSANSEIAENTLAGAVKAAQSYLSEHIVAMYMDCYLADHRDHVKGKLVSLSAGLEADGHRPLTAEEIWEIWESVDIGVHFNMHPSYGLEDVKFLYDNHIIAKEQFKKEALKVKGLPESMMMTEEEEALQARKEAEMYEASTGTQGFAGSKPTHESVQGLHAHVRRNNGTGIPNDGKKNNKKKPI